MNQNIRLTGKMEDAMSKLSFMKEREERWDRLRKLTDDIIAEGLPEEFKDEFKSLRSADRDYVLCGLRDELKERQMALSILQEELRDVQSNVEEMEDGVSSLIDMKSDLEYWHRLIEEEEENNDYMHMSELESRGMAYSDFLAGA